MTFKLESPAFTSGNEIPSRYTCDGNDISPPLIWSGVPKKTRSLALIVDDPDAPDPAAPQMTWVHWILFNIPESASGIPENVSRLPEGTCKGLSDWKRTGYGGPCPPIGIHRYFFKLYALDISLNFDNNPTKTQLEKAMHGHILDEAVLIGTYYNHKH